MNFKALVDFVSGFDKNDVLFIGLGNEWRADDAAGLILLRRLRQRPELKDYKCIEAGSNPENFLQDILDSQASHIIVIDTAKAGNPAGTIEFLKKQQFDHRQISTHTFSVDIIEEYLRRHRPIHFYYLGIEPLTTEFDTSLSDVIKQKIDDFFN